MDCSVSVTFFALSANLSVEYVSSMLLTELDTLAMIYVYVLPPRLS